MATMRQTYIKVLRNSLYSDPRTAANIEQWYLPKARSDLAELEDARKLCEATPEWIDDWVEAGMVGEENELRSAIDYAEKQITASLAS